MKKSNFYYFKKPEFDKLLIIFLRKFIKIKKT